MLYFRHKNWRNKKMLFFVFFWWRVIKFKGNRDWEKEKTAFFFPSVFVTKIQHKKSLKNLDFDRNFCYEVTLMSKMWENKKKIKKVVNRPNVVLFTLFIFVKKKKNQQYLGPYFKKTFAYFCLFQKLLSWDYFREH